MLCATAGLVPSSVAYANENGSEGTATAQDASAAGAGSGRSPELDLSVSIASDWTPQFDADDAPGNDSSATNGVVRVNDTVTYKVNYGVKTSSVDNLTLRLTLPAGMEIL